MINAWRTDDGIMSDIGEVDGRPQIVRAGDKLHIRSAPGTVIAVGSDWFDELVEQPDSRMGASRKDDTLTLRFHHVGGIGVDLDGYTTVDPDTPPGEWSYRVLPDPVHWSDLGEDANGVSLAVLS